MKDTIPLVFALFLVVGCATPRHTVANIRPDSWQVVDAAISAWLRDSPNLTRSDQPLRRDDILIVRKSGLPDGYRPNVPSQKIEIRDLPQGEDPTRSIIYEGEETRPVSMHVVQIDAVRINGNVAEVEISMDRHHKLGAGGTSYKLQRTDTGWFVLPMTKVWQS
jgi:hypothetical protein